MDIATIIVLVAVLLMVLAYVAQPFVLGGGDRAERSETRTGKSRDEMHRRADLLAERNRLYSQINALDFDHSTNKIADEDYASQRHALVAQGVDVLRQLDALPKPDETPAHDPIEAAVLALRLGSVPQPAAKPAAARKGKAKPKPKAAATLYCPNCGKPVVKGDLFCASCGNRL